MYFIQGYRKVTRYLRHVANTRTLKPLRFLANTQGRFARIANLLWQSAKSLNSNIMKIYILRTTRLGQDTPVRYFGTAHKDAKHIVEILRLKNPLLNIELHEFDIITSGKNACKLFEELPF